MEINIKDIIKEFPKMPPHQARAFAKQISKNNNVRNIIIPQKQFIHTQVRACIRHKMTTYESLIYFGAKKEQARDIVREKVEKLYNEWRGDGGINRTRD